MHSVIHLLGGSLRLRHGFLSGGYVPMIQFLTVFWAVIIM